MRPKQIARAALAAMLLMSGAGASAGLASQQFAALGSIQRGQWHLKDATGTVRKICVANPTALLQLHHGNAHCPQTIVENGSESVTVHYSCRGRGYGRTTITVETSTLIQLETQGVLDGMPFASNLEGRRVGGC